MSNGCTMCPRNCNVDRVNELGLCKAPIDAVVYSSMVHAGEEEIVSGTKGSGTVFFAGCNLGCVFCQNFDISQDCNGTAMTASELVRMFLKLQKKGVHNINLVTPGHFVVPIADAIKLAKKMGVCIPFVYNTNGYDSMAALKMMDGLIDIYMPDLKFSDDSLGLRYCGVPDYLTVAQNALVEMYRQVGEPVISHGVMQKGVLIRHLVMPGLLEDSKKALDFIKERLPFAAVNIMPQYRPMYRAKEFVEIARPPTRVEYQSVLDYAVKLGINTV